MNAARWTRLLTAYRHAWGTRSGLQALCRDDDDTAIVKEGQKAELDRLRAGPDGRLYTSDDDHSMYKFDENGNIYVEAPAYTGGGGGGGGFAAVAVGAETARGSGVTRTVAVSERSPAAVIAIGPSERSARHPCALTVTTPTRKDGGGSATRREPAPVPAMYTG